MTTIFATLEDDFDCASCRLWQPTSIEGGEEVGECRRSPPTIVAPLFDQSKDNTVEAVSYASRFPMTAHSDWCGEWTPKPGDDRKVR